MAIYELQSASADLAPSSMPEERHETELSVQTQEVLEEGDIDVLPGKPVYVPEIDREQPTESEEILDEWSQAEDPTGSRPGLRTWLVQRFDRSVGREATELSDVATTWVEPNPVAPLHVERSHEAELDDVLVPDDFDEIQPAAEIHEVEIDGLEL